MKSALALAALAGTTAGLTNQAHAAQYDWNSNTAANSSWTGTVITDGWNVNPASSVTTTLVFSDNSASSFTTSNTAAFTFNTMQLNGGSGGTITIASSSALVASGATPAGIVMNATGTGIYNVTAPFSVSSGETLQFSGAGNDTFNFSGIISGSGALSFTNSNTVNLSGVNTYTGGMTITGGGTINVYNSQVAATGPIVIGSSGTSTGGILNVESGATVSASSITLGNSGSTNPLGETINSAGTVTDSGALSLVRGGFVNMTAGTWTQTGALTVNGNGGFGSTLTVSGGSTFTYNSGTAISVISTASNSAGGATVAIDGTNSTFVTGTNFAGSGSSSSATSIFMIAGGTLKLSGNVASDLFSGIGTVSLQSGTETFNVATFTANTSNVISGNGSLAVTGTTGNLSLSGANTYSGKTYAAGGTLEFGQAAALYGGTPANWTPTNITVSSGATLALATGTGGFTEGNIATLLSQLDVNASGGFQSGAAIGIDTSGGNLTYTSVITNPNSGSLGVAVLGANTLFLVNNETYTGTTTIAAGSHLQIGGGSYTAASISSSGSIVDNGALNFYNGGAAEISNYTYSHVISGAGSLTLNGASSNIITLAANNTYTGTTTIVNSTLQLGNGTLSTGSITGSGSIVDSGALVFDTPAGGFTYNHAISGSGTLTLEANGEMTLFVADSYTGATTISAGRVDVANNASFGGSVVTISGSSTTTSGTGGEALLPTANVTLANNFSISGFGGYEGDSVNYGAIRLGAAAEAITGTVTLTGNSGIAVQTADTGTIFGNISALANTDNLTINNGTQTGTLILTANNTLNSGLTIVQGTLQLGNGSLTTGSISSASSIVDNGTLVFDTATNGFTYSQAISGSGAVTQSGTGVITLVAAETYSGATTIGANATLQIGNGGTVGSFASGSGIINNGTLVFDLSNSFNYSSVFSGSGGLTQAGTGTITMSNTETYTGTTTIDAGGTIQIGSGGTAGSISVSHSIVDSGLLIFDNSSSTLVNQGSNPISGSGALTQLAGGSHLSGINTYTGVTNIAGGELQFDTETSLYDDNTASWTAANIIVSSGAQLQLELGGAAGFTTADLNNILTNASGPVVGATSSAGLEAGSTLGLNDQGASFTISTTIADGGNVLNVSFNGGNTGTEILTQDNTYTGTTAIGTTVQLGSGGAAGSITNTLSIADNGVLVFDTATGYTYSQVISGTGALTQSGSGVIVLTGNDTYTGTTTIAATRTLQLGDGTGSGSVTGSGSIVNSGLLIFDNSVSSADFTYGGAFSGAGAINFSGANTITLTATNTYTGGTTIGATAQVVTGTTGHSNSLGTGSVTILSGGQVVLGPTTVNTTLGNSFTISGNGSGVDSNGAIRLNSGGGVAVIAGTITLVAPSEISTGSGNGYLEGNISGNFALTLGGGVEFQSNDTSNSTITIISGTTNFGDGTAGGQISSISGLSINGGSTALFDSTTGQTISSVISGGGAVTQESTGKLTLTADNTYTGITTIAASDTLQIGNGALTTGSISSSSGITDVGTLVFDTASTPYTYSNVISGAGALTQSGSGVIILTAGDTYTGTTTITAGNTLQIGTTSLATGSISSSTSIVDSGLLVFSNNAAGNFTYSNAISGAGAVNFAGLNTITLSKTNSYTGVTNVGSGAQVVAAASNALGTGAVTIASGGQVFLDNATAITLGNTFTIAGTGSGADSNGALQLFTNADVSGNVVLAGDTLIAMPGGNASIAGNISGNFNLTIGNATDLGGLFIIGNDTSTGTLTEATGIAVDFGQSGAGGVFTSLSGIVANGALNIQSTTAQTYSNVISGASTGDLHQEGSGTLTLTADNTYLGQTLVSTTLQIGNGTLTTGSISSSSSITNAGLLIFDTATTSYAYSNVISGAGALTQSGSGTLILAATNTYTGTTTIATGKTLQLGNGSGSGSITGSGSIVNSGLLVFDNSAATNFLYSNTISGAGAVNFSGGNTITLSKANTYTGGSTIGATQQVTITSTAANALGTGNVTITSGGQVYVTGLSTLGNTFTIAGSGNGTGNDSNGALRLFGAATGAATTLSGGIVLSANAQIDVTGNTASNQNATVLGGISGNFNLTLDDATDLGGLFIKGNSTSTGVLTVATGSAVDFGDTTAGGIVAFSGIVANGNVNFQSATAQTYSNVISGSGGTVQQQGAGVLTLTADETYTGPTAIAASDTLQIGNGVLTIGSITNSSTIADAGLLIFDTSTTNYAYSNNISGAGVLTQSGADTIVLAANNSFSGTVNILAGSTFQIGNGTTGSISAASAINNSGTLAFDSAGSFTYSPTFAGSGGITQAGPGTMIIASNETFTATTTISNGTIQLGTGGVAGNVTASNSIVDNSALVFDTSSNSTYSNVISGSGSVTQSGTGTISLSAANTYSGPTYIASGVLEFTKEAALYNDNTSSWNASNIFVSSGGTLVVEIGSSPNFTQGDLQTLLTNLSGTVGGGFLNGGAIGIDTTLASQTYSNVLANTVNGALDLTKLGTNTLTLTANSTFTGVTTILNGTLQIGTGGTVGSISGTSSIVNSGALIFDTNTTNFTYAAAISSDGNVTFAGADSITLTADNTYTGSTTVNSGVTLNIGNGVLTTGSISSSSSIVDNGSLIFNENGGSYHYSNLISGTGAITIGAATGTIYLENNETYTGTTTINAGGDLIIDDKGTLTVGSISKSTSIVDNGTLQIDNQNVNYAYSNPISGSGLLYKAGNALLTLSAANSFSGTASISNGTYDLNNANALQNAILDAVDENSDAITFVGAAGTTFNLAGLAGNLNIALVNTATTPAAVTLIINTNSTNSVQDYTGALTSSGALTIAGNSAQILAGTNTYTGKTSITSNATLQIGDGTLATGSIVSSSSIVDSGNLSFNVNAPNTSILEYSNVISGSGSVTIAGTGAGGTLTNFPTATIIAIEGDNTYTGTTTITSNGFLEVGGTGSISTSGSIVDNGSLLFDTESPAADTYSNVISGSGNIYKEGTGVITLTGANSYTGGLNIGRDILSLSGNQTAANGALLVQAYSSTAATLNLITGTAQYKSVTVDGTTGSSVFNLLAGSGATVTNLGALTILNGGDLNVAAAGGVWNQTTSGTVTVSGNTGGAGDTSLLGIAGIFNNSSGTIAIAQATNALQANATVSISGTLNTNGGFSFANSTDSIGSLVMNGGTIQATANITGLTSGSTGSGVSGTNVFSLTGTNTINVGTFSVTNGTIALSGSGALTIASTGGGGVLDLNTNNSYTGTTTINSGATLRLGSGGATGSITSSGSIVDSGALVFNTPSTAFTYTNIISASGTVTALAGATVLAANETYTGTTTINAAGELNIGNGTLTVGSITASGNIVDSGILVFNTATTGFTYATAITGSGAIAQSGSGLITLTPTELYTGATTIASTRTLQIGNGGTGGSITGTSGIVDSGLLVFDTATTGNTYSNTISGAGSITQSGTGHITLSGNNSYSGTTTINGGAGGLFATNANSLGISTVNILMTGVQTGSLELAASGSGFTLTNTFSGLGSESAFTSGGLPDIDNVSGNNTITSNLSITGGGGTGINIEADLAAGTFLTLSGNVTNTLTSGRTFDLAGLGNGLVAGNISSSSSGGFGVQKDGTGTWMLTGNSTYASTTAIDAGTLQIGNGGTSGSITSSSAIQNSGALVFDTATNGFTYNSLISGSGTVTQEGADTITLANNETYTGATTIGTGATLLISGSVSTSGSIVDNGTFVLNSSTAGIVYSNVISGSGAVTQSGSGYTALEADETYTGVTTVGGAGLQIGMTSTGSIADSGSIVDNSALNFASTDTGANATYSNIISGSGEITVFANQITLAGNDTYTGSTTISSGATLQLGNGSAAGSITGSSGITNAGALIFNNSSATGQTYNNQISGGGSVAVNAGTVTMGYSAETITGAVTVGSGGTLALAGGNNPNAGLYEAASLTINGTVQTNTDNALFGYTSSNTPTLTINSGGVLTNQATADNGAGTSVRIYSVVNLNGGTLATSGNTSASNTVDGGTGMAEYGSWELYGGINVTANSTISAQQVVAAQSGGLQINVATGDTLNVSGSFITPLGLSDTGIILNPSGGHAGTLLFTAKSDYTAATTIDAGTVQIGSGGAGGGITSTSSITNNGALVFDTSASRTYGMVISGSGSVTQSGTGTITLSNTETYTGTTTISSGTINLTGKLGDTAVTVNNGGTLAAAATTSLGATNGTSLTLLSGSTLNLADGTVGNFTINNSAGSYSGTALSLQGATIDMDLGNSSVDQLVVANGNAVISGTNTINFSTTGDTSLTDGTYTILNVENGTKSASPVFEFANHSTKEAINVGGTYYTLSLVDPSGSEMLDIGSASQSIITLSAAGAGTPTGFTSGQQILNHGTPTTAYQGVFSTGTSALTVTGNNGNYAFKTATHINSQGTGNTNSNQGNTTAYIEINGFNPANDEEIAALGIDDNGSLLTATPDGASISTTSIASDINTYWDASGQSGTIAYVLAGSQYAGVFGTTQYNVYLDFTAGQLANLGLSSSGDNYLAFDFTADPIFNGTSADLTVTAVAVVPEPSSLGLMGLGVMGVIGSRRRRRKNRKA